MEAIAARLRADAEVGPRFAAWHVEPARSGRSGALPGGLDPGLVELLRRRGLGELRSHQARAIELALAGRDVLVATPTASGKTLAYVVPVLQALLASEGRARSLWLFPTKALSRDQSRSLGALVEGLGRPWHAAVYDGDTPPAVRRTLRGRGHVVLTNPWMLHQGILPNHGKWSALFANLVHVVIDEVHTLSGVYGSSVANVLRRLVRIAAHYGSTPTFLLSSATVRNPAEHARRLLGREVEVVDEDGSPNAKRIFAVYDPPLVNPVAGLRASALEEARRLAPRVVGPGHQTIFFCNRRTSVEVLTRYLKELAPRLGLRPEEVRGYRGGYLPLLRREIEEGLKSGEVRAVVSTNALELGIDVGSLDVAVLVGYPGSQASFWQRVGRVGRRGRASLAILIARSDPVDRFLARHPDYLFAAPRESLEIDPENLVLLSEQIRCAAFELPFRGAPGRPVDFGGSPHAGGILDYLARECGTLVERGAPLRGEEGRGEPGGGSAEEVERAWFWAADAYPAQDVSLDGGEPDDVVVLDLDTGKAIGEVGREESITSVHEGAIYQVEGEAWKVERFDYENRRAYAVRVASDYFTEAQTDTEVRVLRLEEEAVVSGAWSAHLGEVHVTTVATLYKKVRFYTRESIGAEDIHLPPEELDTEAFVLVLAEELAAELELARGQRAASWRGLGRLLRRVAPLCLRCRPGDLGLATEIRSRHFRAPAIFLYDRVPGSVGLAAGLFRDRAELLAAAAEVVGACDCDRGCPACVGPVEEVGGEGKALARAILEAVSGSRGRAALA